MSFQAGQAVRIRSDVDAAKEPLVYPFAGRTGRTAHLVAGSGPDQQEDLWVVAIGRSRLERLAVSANPHGDYYEYACSWIPVSSSLLEPAHVDGPSCPSLAAKRPRANDFRSASVIDPDTAGGLQAVADAAAADGAEKRPPKRGSQDGGDADASASRGEGGTSVCVVVCFRDLHSEQKRGAHLAQFVPHMENFFAKAKKRGLCSQHRILVVEQSDDGRKFNRGKLLNIGFDLAKSEGFDVFVFHDVDLLPDDELLESYCAIPQPGKPVHIARVWDRYNANPAYMGGVVAWNKTDYEAINGYPNNYWGWGGEDDEMMRRCRSTWGKDFAMGSPSSGSLRDLEAMDLQQKLGFLKQHKDWKNYRKNELDSEHSSTWRLNGLGALQYQILSSSADPPADPPGVSPMAAGPGTGASRGACGYLRVRVDCGLNGPGQHDEWAGIDYMPEYLQAQTS